MTSITDIPFDDIKLFLIENGIELPKIKEETYNLSYDLIVNGKTDFYPDTIVDWIIAYNFILSGQNIKMYTLAEIHSFNNKDLFALSKKLQSDNSTRQSIINILTYLHKLTNFELLENDIKFAELLPKLGLEAFLSFCATDIKHRQLCDNDIFWEYLYHQHYGEEKLNSKSYKENFIRSYQIEKLINKLRLPKTFYIENVEDGFYLPFPIELKKKIRLISEIKTFDFEKQGLTLLPKEMGALTQLQFLHINCNLLQSLPKEIGNLTNLKILNLNSNNLTHLPEEIGNLTNLKRLSISINQLTSLSNKIGDLVNLKVLNVDVNRLTSLPSEIGKLTKLQHLNLEHNKITSLPKELGNLINLTELYLRYNVFSSLPEEMTKLVSLTSIDYDSKIKPSSITLKLEDIVQENTQD